MDHQDRNWIVRYWFQVNRKFTKQNNWVFLWKGCLNTTFPYEDLLWKTDCLIWKEALFPPVKQQYYTMSLRRRATDGGAWKIWGWNIWQGQSAVGQGVENGWHIKSGGQDRGRVMGYGRGGKSPDTLSTEQCSGDDRGWIHNSRIPISRSRGSQSKAAGGRQHLIPALIWGYTSPSTSNCDQGEYDQYHRIGTDKVIIDNTILYVLIPTLILNNVNICMYDSIGISYC